MIDHGYVERIEDQNRNMRERISDVCKLFLTKENNPPEQKTINVDDFWRAIDPDGILRYNFRREGYVFGNHRGVVGPDE